MAKGRKQPLYFLTNLFKESQIRNFLESSLKAIAEKTDVLSEKESDLAASWPVDLSMHQDRLSRF